MPKVDIAFDTFHNYDVMTASLRELAAAYPRLCTLTSIAKTFRGREVWFMTITKPDTGPALEKPGYYIDAQIHAEEHATSATALYACWHLLTHYGTDPEVTRLVDQQAVYIIPRINPDGAEYTLTAPYHPWCGNGRFLPEEDRIDGLIPQDLTGDGYLSLDCEGAKIVINLERLDLGHLASRNERRYTYSNWGQQ
jgi:murein tripeptide amidase MpaA